MKEIKLASFAKINLSLNVTGVRESGMHEVDMLMQQISFHDEVTLRYEREADRKKGELGIRLKTNRNYLPQDQRNTAWKAADLMIRNFGERIDGGTVYIDIYKRIPVAAGMAGGSGNAAAVLHGLNFLWKLGLSLRELCRFGGEIGSDVPFCVMGQARNNYNLYKNIRRDPLACSCARATGTGTALEPVKGIHSFIVIARPQISVSTGQVYQGIDACEIVRRPDNDRLMKRLNRGEIWNIYPDCVNVLEAYTLEAYPEVGVLKKTMEKMKEIRFAMMSGSGPTVFGICKGIEQAKTASDFLREKGYEAYWTKTTR